ncbi:MAG TPA: glutathione synthase [Deltaproteobacteria bacterium]|nr:glutathione synthase [Deltaproteobacteria bacterium]
MSRRRKSLKLLFVADPLSHFHPERETSLLMMHEAQRRGHEIFATTPAGLSARGRELKAVAQKLEILGIGKTPWYRVRGVKSRELRSFDAVMLRKDPPFDEEYLHHLYMLDLLSDDIYMMNHPRGILTANEKIFPLPFSDLIPDTLVSADFEALRDFIREQSNGVVIKPVNSSGGRGVFRLRGEDSDNFRVILETATSNFTRHVIAQAFLPEIEKGDKRIMLLGDEILGCFIRKPAPGEHRANLHSGGSAHAAALNHGDLRIIQRLRPLLERLGLDFVGLDIIGKCLTEVNVTSPMGLAEINATIEQCSQSTVIEFIEKKIAIKWK